MFCRKCHYDLRGHSTHRCSECGDAFNPTDPKTFLLELPPKPDYVRRFIAFVIIAIAVALVIQTIAAMSQSGH